MTSIPVTTRQSRSRLLLLQTLCGLVAVSALWLWVVYVPGRFAQLQTICTGTNCGPQQVTLETAQAMADAGLAIQVYAGATSVIEVLFTIVFVVVATTIVWRRSTDGMALFVALFLVLFGTTFISDGNPAPLTMASPVVRRLDPLLRFAFNLILPLFFYLFPDGYFVPRWTRVLAALWIAWRIALALFPNSPLRMLMGVLWPTFIGSWLFAQIYRYRRVSTPGQRQQTKWVVFGLTTAFVSTLLLRSLPSFVPGLDHPFSLGSWIVDASFILFLSFVPLTIGIAILRYRLFDIDIIIRRTLIYGALTTILAAVYVGSVVVLQRFVQTLTGDTRAPVVTVASTLVIAALFQPLRHRIQTIIDRRFYRRKYDAQKTLQAFSMRLRDETDVQVLTADMLGVVQETLRPAHASLWLREPQRDGKRGGTHGQ